LAAAQSLKENHNGWQYDENELNQLHSFGRKRHINLVENIGPNVKPVKEKVSQHHGADLAVNWPLKKAHHANFIPDLFVEACPTFSQIALIL